MPLLTIGLMVKGLDEFYAEPANVNVTIRNGLLILAKKVDGMSSHDVETLTAIARKDAKDSAFK